MYDTFWFITDYDFTNGKFIEYLQKMFSYMIGLQDYGGLYDKYLSVYLKYANMNKENYEKIVTHLTQELEGNDNTNIKKFLHTFQHQHTEKQLLNRNIEEILTRF